MLLANYLNLVATDGKQKKNGKVAFMSSSTECYRFDVAFSFAGPHREKVRAIAEIVAAKLGRERVLYDDWYEAEILGPNMRALLQRFYYEQSLVVVADLSDEYAGRPWCQAESEAIDALRMSIDSARDETARLRLLNAKFGDGRVPGVLPNAGYLDGINKTAEQCAELILQRHALLVQRMTGESAPALVQPDISPPIPSSTSNSPRSASSTEKPAIAPRITDVVLLVHGIRTHAAWQVMVTDVLESPTVKVFPIKYGYFNSLRFLSPFESSREPVERLEREIRDVRESYPGARISIIAHSFGTYVVSKILQEQTDIRVHRVIFCGSVVKENFRWNQVKSRIGEAGDGEMRRYVVNECGTHDVWPILGKSAGWGYGAAGTDGFGTALVSDRYHRGRHALYFNRDFVEKYWKPFIHRGEIVHGEGNPNEGVPLPLRLLGSLPLNWLIPAFIAITVVLLYSQRPISPTPPDIREVSFHDFLEQRKDVVSPEAKKLFAADYRGSWVRWKGVVIESTSRPTTISIGETSKSPFSDQAVFRFEDRKDFVPKSVGVSVELIGQIEEIDDIRGISLSSAQIVIKQKTP